MKKIGVSLVLLFIIVFCFSSIGLAHGGGTDSEGGHRDRNNVSGLGNYHYHHGYEAHLHPDGICPYDYDNAETSSSYADTDTNTQSFAERDDVFIYDSNKDYSGSNEIDEIIEPNTPEDPITKVAAEDFEALAEKEVIGVLEENWFFSKYVIEISNFLITIVAAVIIIIIIIVGVFSAKRARAKAEKKYADEYNIKLSRLVKDKAAFQEEKAKHNEILNSKKQTYPWLAKLFADYEYTRETETYKNTDSFYSYLNEKHAPEEFAKIAAKKRMLQERCKMCEYQIRYYEALFPGLKVYKTGNPIKMWDKIKNMSAEEKEEMHKMTDEEKHRLISKWNDEKNMDAKS